MAVYERTNLVAKTLLPESFACLFDPRQTFDNLLRTLGNPLRAVFSKVDIFSGTAILSSLHAGASIVSPRVLAFWAKTLPGQLRGGGDKSPTVLLVRDTNLVGERAA